MKLDDMKKHYSFIKEIRGQGLMLGVELDMPGKQIVVDAIEEGMLINCTHDTVLRFLPPYILGEREVDIATEKLNKIFKRI
jgi:acetylornithine/succinyldiaminopimelate/putrescine aminotransferase